MKSNFKKIAVATIFCVFAFCITAGAALDALEVKTEGAGVPAWADYGDGFWHDSSEQNKLSPADISAELGLENVLLLADSLITVTDAINYNSSNDFKLQTTSSGTGIVINNSITNTGTGEVTLTTAGAVIDNYAGGIVVSGLAVRAAGAVTIIGASTDVDALAIDTSTGKIQYTDVDGFIVGTVDGVAGMDTAGGSVELTAMSGDITVTDTFAGNDIGATTTIALTAAADEGKITIATGADVESTGGTHTYIADKMDIAGTITATGQKVTLMAEHEFDNDAINLGSALDTTTHTLELSDAELDRIMANTLVIGEAGQAGAITVSSDISPANITNLHLINNCTVTATALSGGGIVVSRLAVEAAGAVYITEASTDVDTLAINTSTGNIQFTENGGFTVGTVDGVTGISTIGGDITLAASGPITASADITTTGDGDIAITATGTNGTAGDDITVQADVFVASDVGDIMLTTGDNITQATGGLIWTGGAGTITLTAGNEGVSSNDDVIGSITQSGTAQIISTGGTITLTAGPANMGSYMNFGAGVTGGNIAITSINAGDGAVIIRADSFDVASGAYGQITDVDGGTGLDITGGMVILTAAGGIGAAGAGGAIEVDAAMVSALNRTSGGIFLNAIGSGGTSIMANALTEGDIEIYGTGENVTLTNVVTADGAVTASVTEGDIIATLVTATGTGRNVTLTTTTSGDIFVGNVTAAADTITVNSAGAVEESGSDFAVDLTASRLNIDAVMGIGAFAPIETAASSISADTVSGNIDLDNALATAVTATSLTTGTGNILFSQSGGGSLTVGSATTDNGNITIEVIDADLLCTGLITAGGSGNVELTALANSIDLFGDVTARGDSVILGASIINLDASISASELIISSTAATMNLLDRAIVDASLIVDTDLILAGNVESLFIEGLDIFSGKSLDISDITLYVNGNVETILDGWIVDGRLFSSYFSNLNAVYVMEGGWTVVTPEPATILLLTLGGLVLRKHRR